MLFKELAPLLIDKSTIGLHRILNLLTTRIPCLQRKGLAVEIEACQQRLTALPSEVHGITRASGDIGSDKGLKHLITHDLRA